MASTDEEINEAFASMHVLAPEPRESGGLFFRDGEFVSFKSLAGAEMASDPFQQFGEGQQASIRKSSAFRPYRPRANAFCAITDDSIIVPESPLALINACESWSPDSVRATLTNEYNKKVKQSAQKKRISSTHARVQHEIHCW